MASCKKQYREILYVPYPVSSSGDILHNYSTNQDTDIGTINPQTIFKFLL